MSEPTLGQLIVAARERHHLSQSELADKVGVAKYTIHRWEHDLAIPRSYAQRVLITLLGIPEEALGRRKQEEDISQYMLPEEQGLSEEAVQEILDGLKVYHGWREGTDERKDAIWEKFVEVDGHPLPSFDPKWYQYEWGYVGKGPSNLALAMLADYFEEKQEPDPWKTYQAAHYASDFLHEVIAYLPHANREEWWITSIDIAQWLEKHQNE